MLKARTGNSITYNIIAFRQIKRHDYNSSANSANYESKKTSHYDRAPSYQKCTHALHLMNEQLLAVHIIFQEVQQQRDRALKKNLCEQKLVWRSKIIRESRGMPER